MLFRSQLTLPWPACAAACHAGGANVIEPGKTLQKTALEQNLAVSFFPVVPSTCGMGRFGSGLQVATFALEDSVPVDTYPAGE